MTSSCPGCGVVLPEVEGPRHRYVNASPACWAAYGQVLAAEYSDPVIFAACHGLSVDAYTAQHPGGDHPVRSVVVRLAGLHLDLERGIDASGVVAARRRLVDREWVGPDPVAPERWGALTVVDLAAVAGVRRTSPASARSPARSGRRGRTSTAGSPPSSGAPDHDVVPPDGSVHPCASVGIVRRRRVRR